jgi:hypothetical protein
VTKARGEFIGGFEEVRTLADEYRLLDDERVLVATQFSARGGGSGLALTGKGAILLHIREGKGDEDRPLLGAGPRPLRPRPRGVGDVAGERGDRAVVLAGPRCGYRTWKQRVSNARLEKRALRRGGMDTLFSYSDHTLSLRLAPDRRAPG